MEPIRQPVVSWRERWLAPPLSASGGVSGESPAKKRSDEVNATDQEGNFFAGADEVIPKKFDGRGPVGTNCVIAHCTAPLADEHMPIRFYCAPHRRQADDGSLWGAEPIEAAT